MSTWFLIIFLSLPTGESVDKVAVQMKGTVEHSCVKDKTGIWRYPTPIEGVDRHKILTVCVSEKHWRGKE
jgi:hypothetical protein